MKQEPGETAKDYYIRLKERIERCDYDDAEQEKVLKEQFIIGSADQKLRRRAAWTGFESSLGAVEFSTLNETIRLQERTAKVNALLRTPSVNDRR